MPPLRVLQVSDLHAGTQEEPEVEGDLRTLAELQRHWPELEPVYRSERLVVCGLNSVRPWKQQGGALRRPQLERVANVFAEAPEDALRVVAVHHHGVRRRALPCARAGAVSPHRAAPGEGVP